MECHCAVEGFRDPRCSERGMCGDRPMTKGDHKFRECPDGSKIGGYRRPRVQIGFDKAQIEIISRWALFNNRSFAAEVRALVSEGLARRTR